MILTRDLMIHVMPHSGQFLEMYFSFLLGAMESYLVDQPLEVAAFLATLAEESGELRYSRELWGPTTAQLKYEGSAKLGNTQPGDGERFKGRGLIQVSGRANYAAIGKLMDLRLTEKPELLAEPVYAAYSAAVFWWDRRIEQHANRGDFTRVTRLVNGGLTNMERREIYYRRACTALGI